MKKLLDKIKRKEASEPRAMTEISKEAGDLTFKLGQARYQEYVYAQEVLRINRDILNLNQEAAARNSLDQQAKKDAPKDVKNG